MCFLSDCIINSYQQPIGVSLYSFQVRTGMNNAFDECVSRYVADQLHGHRTTTTRRGSCFPLNLLRLVNINIYSRNRRGASRASRGLYTSSPNDEKYSVFSNNKGRFSVHFCNFCGRFFCKYPLTFPSQYLPVVHSQS